MSGYSYRCLAVVFGPESSGGTPEERARSSNRLWVRSQDHLSYYRKRVGVPGLIMNSVEALACFGFDVLDEAIDRGSAIIVNQSLGGVPAVLGKKRLELGLSPEDVERLAGIYGWSVTKEEVLDAENQDTRTKMTVICAICAVLDLDARTVGFK